MRFALTILTTLFINFASSQSNKAVYTSLSTVGLGLGYQNQFHSKLGYDVNINYINLRPSVCVGFLANDRYHRITANLKSFQGEATLKWYPFGNDYYGQFDRNKFFIRAGISFKNNSSFRVYSDYQLKRLGTIFLPNDTTNGRIDIQFKTINIQPYLGLGFQALNNESNFILNFEAGLFYHHKPEYTMTETGSRIYKIENSARAKKYISYLVVYPQIKIAFGYKLPYL